jgi:hypothetical protein
VYNVLNFSFSHRHLIESLFSDYNKISIRGLVVNVTLATTKTLFYDIYQISLLLNTSFKCILLKKLHILRAEVCCRTILKTGRYNQAYENFIK